MSLKIMANFGIIVMIVGYVSHTAELVINKCCTDVFLCDICL